MSKRWRWLGGGAAAVVLAALAAFFGLAWHYSNVLDEAALDAQARRDDLLEVEYDDSTVESLQPGAITLAVTDSDSEVLREGTWGLAWPGGYGLLTEIHEGSTGETVTRSFDLIEGEAPQAGSAVEVDSRAVPTDGGEFFRENAVIVDVPGLLGDYPSRYVPGASPTWVLLVNGNSLDWRDLARLAPALHGAGYHVLFVTLRNSPGAPEDPGGRLTYGKTEWEDLDAAVRYAVGAEARDIVLIAASMGGGVVMSFFLNAPETAASIRAVVFDAPMLSFRRAVEFQAGQISLPLVGVGLPEALTGTARWLATLRFDVDWDATDYLDDGDALTAPTLIFHGDADDDVPIDTSREFAERNPGNVTLVEVAGAVHIASWNADPAAYEARLLQFLDETAE